MDRVKFYAASFESLSKILVGSRRDFPSTYSMLREDLKAEATNSASCSINPIFRAAECEALQSLQIAQL